MMHNEPTEVMNYLQAPFWGDFPHWGGDCECIYIFCHPYDVIVHAMCPHDLSRCLLLSYAVIHYVNAVFIFGPSIAFANIIVVLCQPCMT